MPRVKFFTEHLATVLMEELGMTKEEAGHEIRENFVRKIDGFQLRWGEAMKRQFAGEHYYIDGNSSPYNLDRQSIYLFKTDGSTKNKQPDEDNDLKRLELCYDIAIKYIDACEKGRLSPETLYAALQAEGIIDNVNLVMSGKGKIVSFAELVKIKMFLEVLCGNKKEEYSCLTKS